MEPSFQSSGDCVDGDTEKLVFYYKASFASLGIISTLFAIVLLIKYKSYKYLLFRTFLYTVIANLFQAIIQVLDAIPAFFGVKHTGWLYSCKVFGYLDQVACWIDHVCMAWLFIYILYLLVKKKGVVKSGYSSREAYLLVMIIFASSIINIFPFGQDYYGFTGGWCWIKHAQSFCNDSSIRLGLSYATGLYYGPILVFAGFNFLACFLLFLYLFRNNNIFDKTLKFIIFYPLCYLIILIISISCRVNATVRISHREKLVYQSVILHAVVDTLRITFPTVLLMIAFYKIRNNKNVMNVYTVMTDVPTDECTYSNDRRVN